MKPSIRARILPFVEICPGQTATQIAAVLGEKANSVSSMLRKLVNEGFLVEVPGAGPRGGSGFILPAHVVMTPRRTAWEHILDEDSPV